MSEHKQRLQMQIGIMEAAKAEAESELGRTSIPDVSGARSKIASIAQEIGDWLYDAKAAVGVEEKDDHVRLTALGARLETKLVTARMQDEEEIVEEKESPTDAANS